MSTRERGKTTLNLYVPVVFNSTIAALSPLPVGGLTITFNGMSAWPKAILFDFDGVIVNSEPIHFRAFADVLREEGIEISETEYYQELIGFDDKGAIVHLFQKRGRGLDANTFARLLIEKSEATMSLIRKADYTALPGALAFVREMHQKYPLAICSGALRAEIEAMLVGVGLRDCFRVIVAAEDVAIGKPDPSGYLLTTRLLAEQTNIPLTPQDCLIVEDAPTVIANVRKVGFKVIGVATSYPLEKLAHANYPVASLEPAIVKKAIPELLI